MSSRWRDWHPPNISDGAPPPAETTQSTQFTDSGSSGTCGNCASGGAHVQNIRGQFEPRPPVSETDLEQAIRWAAVDLLNAARARQFHLDGRFTIGLWTVTDTPALRAAIAVLHPRGVPIVHLEDDHVPARYRQYGPPDRSKA